ncbi:MAG: glycosyl hydrolase [Gemmatimonadota bacterium]
MNSARFVFSSIAATALIGGTVVPAQAQNVPYDPASITALQWRNIGPNRGGRSIAAAGSPSRPYEFYFGATGGGVWKTTDGGTTWAAVTDGQIRSSSVGAIAVAPSNPDVVYVGMGETQLRANVMQGDGVYRSTDAGKTWTHAGLANTQAIGRVRVHPRDPNLVYVAALGHPYGPNEERGVFRSADGGRSWRKILFRDARTGAADLVIDPNDPRVLYATLWQVYRKPWILWSGGAGSGLFKSIDGGETWTELTRNPGLPAGVLGKITVAVGANSRRVYANVEATDGGLYRSDDAGATWTKVNGNRDLWQRAFYFLRMTADPKDPETLYQLNFELLKSTDGGRTFTRLAGHHADYHDLWIDPTDNKRMIVADDGGASVSVNGGTTWTARGFPTAQIYRVTTTSDVPYHVCGAQQDNTTVCVPSDGGHLRNPDSAPGDWFYEVGGGESATIAAKPNQPDIFYAGATNALTRYDRRTGQERDVQPYPRLVMGEPAGGMRERWNWNYPIATTALEPDAVYAGSQHLWKSVDEGKSWRRISPDLTRADSSTLGNTGGAIVFDQDGPEVYATIFTIAPSRKDARTIWVGSDDGLVHITRDGGASWTRVTPPDLPPFSRVSRIDASPHRDGSAYLAVKRYELDDRSPHIWRTSDFGKSWTRIVTGIREDAYVHVVREDPARAGLLYAGTEHGVYVSFDDGAHWQPLSLNLPDLQISDLVVEGRDLVIATHGRSFWVLDDISPLRQLSAVTASAVHLFEPSVAVRRMRSNIDYWLAAPADSVIVELTDAAAQIARRLTGLPRSRGLNRISWDGRYTGSVVFPGIILEGGDPRRGPFAPPGQYQIRLTSWAGPQATRSTRTLELRRDPRLTNVTDADLREQFELALRVRDATTAANQAVIDIRELRTQLTDRARRASSLENQPLVLLLTYTSTALAAVESELYQVKNQSAKDKIAFPIKLNDRLTGLRSNLERGDGPPPESYRRVFQELSAELETHLTRYRTLIQRHLVELNAQLVGAGLPVVELRRIVL